MSDEHPIGLNMKVYILTIKLAIVALFTLAFAGATSTIEKSNQVSSTALQEELIKKQESKTRSDFNVLRYAKREIINGNLTTAKRYLQNLRSEKDISLTIKDRYMAIIYFIDEKYEKSLEILEQPHFSKDNFYKRICMLKITNMLMLNKTNTIEKELTLCQQHLNKYSTSENYWIENIVHAKLKDKFYQTNWPLPIMETMLQDVPTVERWLRLSLYYNQENYVINNLWKLSDEAYDSKQIRDIIGLIYYRTQNTKMSKEFIEDSTSANAENIRGNIYLNERKYELAYSHFKLALQKKRNSQNAMQRALPLAWILGQWDDGLKLSKKITHKEEYKLKKQVLELAFLTRMKKNKDALKIIEKLADNFPLNSPQEFNQVASYNALILKRPEIVKKFASRACNKYDGLNCWLLLQNSLWEDLSETINRTDPVYSNNEITMDNLKKRLPSSSLEEEVFIDQRDIEELDAIQKQTGQ